MLMQTLAQANWSRQPAAGRGERPIGSQTLFGFIELIGATMPFSRNAEIYGDDEPADYLYKVVSGAVRVCKLLENGRRQIAAFCLPGEIFGFGVGDKHRFTAEAIVNSRVLVVRRSTVVALAARDDDLARQLWMHTAEDLRNMQEHMLLLGCLSARERVAAFLLRMAKRVPGSNEVELPMSRQDIADYLGLTIETVSRTISKLLNDATIGRSTSRHIVLRNHAALRRLDA